MYCYKCGAQNDDNAFRCVKCGVIIQEIPLPPSAPGPSDDRAMRMLLPIGRSGLAIAAGYAGLFAVLILPAPIAFVLGVLAVWDIRRNPEKHGMGRAVFGLVMGALGTAILVVMIVVLVLALMHGEG